MLALRSISVPFLPLCALVPSYELRARRRAAVPLPSLPSSSSAVVVICYAQPAPLVVSRAAAASINVAARINAQPAAPHESRPRRPRRRRRAPAC
eukprot:scaffold15954_cov62-Phaeocystis_antarctica.AAC.6